LRCEARRRCQRETVCGRGLGNAVRVTLMIAKTIALEHVTGIDKVLITNMFKGFVPLVLLSIIHRYGPIYALEITRVADAESNGVLPLNIGSIYPTLEGLRERGLVTTMVGDSPRGGTSVVLYEITDKGLEDLQMRQARAKEFNVQVNRLLRI
jgi:DNA-binding PadR family transcriptional regulator